MMGYGWGMSMGGWIVMTVFWVALLALVVWLVTRAFSPGRAEGSTEQSWRESADQVLDRRFAAGEIDEATYHRMRETLRSGRSPRTTQG